jgi:hypothetical protein
MSNDSKQRDPEITAHQKIQQSLRLLDRTISWFRWNTIVMGILLLAVLAMLSAQQLAGWFAIPQQLDVTVIVGGLLVLLSTSNGYALYRQHHFKLFREAFPNRCKSPKNNAYEPKNFTVWLSSIGLPGCTTGGSGKKASRKRSRELSEIATTWQSSLWILIISKRSTTGLDTLPATWC